MDRLCQATLYPDRRPVLPEVVLQFGEGVFLRGFVDELLDDLNRQGLLHGGVAVVQPRAGAGKLDALNAQDGLYTLILRGLQDGQRVEHTQVVSVVSRGIDPYERYAEYLALIESEALRYVVSNTTEAGIAYRAEDRLDDAPPLSFPGKVAQLLYRRYQKYDGERSKGLIVIPCELIEDNGDQLKRLVKLHAQNWHLEPAFFSWIDEACIFANTLVDRIVTGYPATEADEICAKLGYRDELLVTAEPYSLFAIEGAPDLARELPMDKAALNVVLTDDIAPFRTRKVRILNGAHTALAPAALLMGIDTVGEAMADPLLRQYVNALMDKEVIPAMGADEAALRVYTQSVFERFDNPFIQHRLTGIAMNTTSKWRARLLPSLVDYHNQTGAVAPLIAFALAAALELFETRGAELNDSERLLDLYEEIAEMPGLQAKVEAARGDIRAHGCREALEMRL